MSSKQGEGEADTLLPATADTQPAPARGAESATHAPGARVGRYEVRGVLGRGGMGVVYAAFDRQLDRKVAVKLLRTELAADREAAEVRMLREGRAIAKLAHPNVVTVFELGTHEGAVFIAMELVEGHSLDRWIAERSHPWREVVEVFVQAGTGLAAAHAAGLVHRDFKPANVLLGHDGRARVTDFGVARIAESEGRRSVPVIGRAEDVRLTATGAVIGTPAYMPPEQLDGEPADERADQFSFAASLYEALYGERPFAGTTLGELYDSVTAERVRPAPAGSDVPTWLRAVVLRGLRANRDERFPSMTAMLEALRRDPAVQRRRLIGASTGVLALGGVAVAFAMTRPTPPDCAGDADRELEAAWRYVRARLPASALATAIDARAAEWRTTAVALCRKPAADPVVRGREQSCLGFHLDSLATLGAQLAASPTPEHVALLTSDLRNDSPADCASHPLDLYPVPLPDSVPERTLAVQARTMYMQALAGGGGMTVPIAAARARDALDLAQRSRHEPTIANAWAVLGGTLLDQSDRDGAVAAWRKSITAAERGNAQKRLAFSHVLLANVLCSRTGRVDDCDSEMERATTYFAAHPEHVPMQFALTHAGYEGARLAPEAGIAGLETWIGRHPEDADDPYVTDQLAQLAIADGRPALAVRVDERSLARARKQGPPLLVAENLTTLVSAHLHMGDVVHAREACREITDMASQDEPLGSDALICRTLVSRATGDIRDALAAIEELEEPDGQPTLRAALRAIVGKYRDARAVLGSAPSPRDTYDWTAVALACDHIDVALAERDLSAARTLLEQLVVGMAEVPKTGYAWFAVALRQVQVALASGRPDDATEPLAHLRALISARGDESNLMHRLLVEILAAEQCERTGGTSCATAIRSPLEVAVAGGTASLEVHVARLLADASGACREWKWLAPYQSAPLVRAIDAARYKRCR